MKITPLLLFLGVSSFLTGCNANQAHYDRPYSVWQWHDLWKAGDIYDDSNDSFVGIVDENGYVYDRLRNRLGLIETIGTIKKNKTVIGYIRNHLDVYNARHEWVGNVDKQGYILDRNEKLNGKLHEDDFTTSSINFSERPGLRFKGAAHYGTLEYSDEVYDLNEKKVGTVTYIPQETDYQAIPVSHPDDRMITSSRPYGAILLLDYDKAVVQHKAERAKYAYLCSFAYTENKREIYNNLHQLIGYMDKRDGFDDRSVYDLKHRRVGFVSYGGTDQNYTDINFYDDGDRAVGKVPYGFEDSAARMLLDGINNMHVPWDGFEECDGGTLDQHNILYDVDENKIGHLDQNMNVLDLQEKIIGHIGPEGTLFDEKNKLIAKPFGHKGDAVEVYKGKLSKFEEAHKILKTYQDRQREIEDQKIREEHVRAKKIAEEKAKADQIEMNKRKKTEQKHSIKSK